MHQTKKKDKNIMIKNNTKIRTNKIHWKALLKRIKQDENFDNITVVFNNERILWKNALILGKNGFEVPQELIDYDDENINYSDITPITDEDIESGKIKWTINTELTLDKEIKDWIKKENINLNEFAAKLIQNFYDNIKSLPKNVAL